MITHKYDSYLLHQVVQFRLLQLISSIALHKKQNPCDLYPPTWFLKIKILYFGTGPRKHSDLTFLIFFMGFSFYKYFLGQEGTVVADMKEGTVMEEEP